MKDPVPHESDEALCYLSAREALDAFGKGTLKPSTLLDALIRRIDRYNPIINALADMYYEEARDAAKRADEAYQSGTAQGALLGVPVLIKDAQRIQGKRTTYGSLLFMDGPADTVSDPMIERLLGAGAIILGRTTTPEFCISGVCRSHAWGNTVIPIIRPLERGDPRAGLAQHSLRDLPRSPRELISAGLFASRQAAVALSDLNPRTGEIQMDPPQILTATIIVAPWPAPLEICP